MTELASWAWWIAAAVLLAVELLAPAMFCLWLALAAAIVAILHMVAPLPWQSELAIFCGLSVLLVFGGRPWLLKRRSLGSTDAPNLNQRQLDFIGRVYVLERPIKNGTGTLRIDDTFWDISGPELEAGVQVKVTGVSGRTLTVAPVPAFAR